MSKKNLAYINNETSLLSQNMMHLKPYSPTSSRDKIDNKKSEKKPLKLDWNEATIQPSPRVKEAILKALSESSNIINWYPELYSKKLKQKLAKYTERKSSEIIVTNGSDDGLELICKVFLDNNDEVIVSYPTYTHFLTYVKSRGAKIIKAESPNVFQPTISSIIENITPFTKLIYIVNPNNPTGTLFSKQEIERILKIATNSIVLIDEAYFEFAKETVVSLIDKYPNLIVSRTFSKAWAMAGLRIGYQISSASTIFSLSKLFNPKSVNVLAQTAALAALDDISYLNKYVNEVEKSKIILLKFLKSKNIVAFNSKANYIMVQYPKLHKLISELEKENVYVRDRSMFEKLPNFFRITLGTVSDTLELIERFKIVFLKIENK